MNELIKTATGERIPFYSASLSIDKSSFVWSFNAEIADKTNLDKLKPVKSLRGDYVEISFKLGTTKWELIAELPSYNNGNNSFSISGRSKTVFLTDEFANQLTKTWKNTTSRAIVQELCDGVGIVLDWKINDWRIDTYTATDRAPKDIIAELVGEKKAILQSSPDSRLIVLPNLPCSPKKLAETVPNYFLSTNRNIFERPHRRTNKKNYNKLAVTKQTNSQQNAPSISVEDETQGNDKLLKVIVNPPVSAGSLSLSHASGNHIKMYYEGIKQQTVTDQLVISGGKAQLSKPFGEIKSIEWHQNVLAEFAINQKGEITTENGLGLIDITYLSPFHQYRIQHDNIKKAVFEIADIPPTPELNALHIDYIIDSGERTMPSIVVNTLSTPADLIERAQQELWEQVYDVDEYSIECGYENVPPQLASVANVKINKEALIFNGYIKSLSLQIGTTITQTLTIERPIYE